MLSSALLFAQSAKAAGVSVSVKKHPVDSFWSNVYGKSAFTHSSWGYRPFFPQWLQSYQAFNKEETNWTNPKANKLVQKAVATVDDAKRKELAHEAQTIEWNEGGYVIWGFQQRLDGLSERCRDSSRAPSTRSGGTASRTRGFPDPARAGSDPLAARDRPQRRPQGSGVLRLHPAGADRGRRRHIAGGVGPDLHGRRRSSRDDRDDGARIGCDPRPGIGDAGSARPRPSAVVRYGDWMAGLAHGDLGTSPSTESRQHRSSKPLATLRSCWCHHAPTGPALDSPRHDLRTATRRRVRYVDSGVTLVGLSLCPSSSSAIRVLLFAIAWPLLPAVAYAGDAEGARPARRHAPAASSLGYTLANGARERARDAHHRLRCRWRACKGMPETPDRHHVLPNALVPSLPRLCADDRLARRRPRGRRDLFGYPGVGQRSVDAVNSRDVPRSDGPVVIVAAVYVIGTCSRTSLTVVLTPRLRTSK